MIANVKSILSRLLLFASVTMATLPAWAVPTTMTFQSKIFKPDNTALEAAAVNFRFTTLDPTGTCILYVEDFMGQNMQGSAGLVIFNLGTGAKAFPVGAYFFSGIFDNLQSSFSCQGGGTFVPGAARTDSRKIILQFNDGSNAGWQTLPAVDITSVPYANFAGDSQKLAGFDVTQFLRTSALPTCAAGTVLTFNGASLSCVSNGSGGTVTGIGTSAVAGNPLTIAGTAAVPTVNIQSATTTQNGYLLASDFVTFNNKQNALGFTPLNRANNLSDLISATTARTNLGLGTASTLNVSAAGDAGITEVVKGNDSRLTGAIVSGGAAGGDLAGTYPNPTLANVVIAGTATKITYNAKGQVTVGVGLAATDIPLLDATKITTGTLPIVRGGTNAVTANGALNNLLPAQTSNATKFLQTDGANTSWVFGNSGTVTNVTGTLPISVATGTSTPSISIATADTTTTGALSFADWNIFNNKLTSSLATTKIFVGNGSGVAMPVTMSGDATLDNAGVLNLVTSGVTANTYGSANQVVQVTVDAKGRITSATNVTIDDTTKLPKAGGTMTGSIAMGGNNLSGAGNIAMNTNKTFLLSNLTNTEESALIATPLTAADKGKSWFNASTNSMMYWDGTSAKALGISGAGITSLNGSSVGGQTITAGISGTDLTVSTVGGTGVTTINLPTASATNRGALASSDFTTFNNKLTSSLASTNIFVGNGSGVAMPVVLSGDAALSATGALTLNTVPATKGGTGQTIYVTGDLLFASSPSALSKLAASAGGLVLTSNGVGTAPSWQAVTAGTVTNVTSANSYLSVASGTTTPVITLNVGTLANTVAAGDDSRITGAAQKSANLSDLSSALTARGNLGLGTSSTLNVAVAGDAGITEVVKGNDSRLINAIQSGSTAGGDLTGTYPNPTLANVVIGATNTKITYDAKGRITAGAPLAAADIPSLDTAILTSGTLPLNRGGTNAVTANGALNNLLPTQTSNAGKVLQTDGANTSWVFGNSGTVTNVTGTLPISVATGTSTPSISIATADTTTTGALSFADWNIFNNKLTSSLATTKIFVGNGSGVAMPVTMSGDATLDNAGVLNLVTSGVTANTYGSANQVVQVTVDAKGRITSATNVTIDDATKLPKAGGTMTGSIAMGGNNLSGAGNIAMNTNKTFLLSNLTNTEESALIATPLTTADKGKSWFNASTNSMMYWDGTSAKALGVSGAGITSINGSSVGGQTIVSATTGTDFSVSTSGGTGVTTIALPTASATNRGALASADFTTFNNKLTSSLATTNIFVGNGSGVAMPVTLSGDAALSATGALTLNTVPATKGGTGQTSYVIGDLLFASSTTALSNLAASTGGLVLTSNGIGIAPSWQAVTAGTVTNVSSANSYLSVATGTTTPVLTVNVGTIANTVAAGDDSRITGAAQKSANLSDLSSALTARGNLGLGTSSTLNVAVAGDAGITEVVKGNDSRLTNAVQSGSTAGGDLTGTYPNPTLTNSGAIAATYGSAQQVAQVVVDLKGRISSATNVTIDDTTKLPLAGGTMTGAIITAAGTAVAPALGVGAATLGLFKPGVNILGLSTTGTERMRIDATGNVGIGTAAPSTHLQLEKAGGSSLRIGDTAGAWLQLDGGSGGRNITGNYTVSIFGSGGLNVTTGGNVGIGTTTPNTALDINGAESMRGIAAPAVSAAGQGRIYFDSTSNTYKVSQNNGAYSDLATAASVGTSYVAKAGDTMTGALVNTTNSTSTALAVTQAGAGYAASFVGGNVGIGTTSPTAKLDIAAGNVTTAVSPINISETWNNAAVTFPGHVESVTGTAYTTGSKTFDYRFNGASYFSFAPNSQGGTYALAANSPHGQALYVMPRGVGNGASLYSATSILTLGNSKTDSVYLYGATLARVAEGVSSAADYDLNINAGDGYGGWTGAGGALKLRGGNANGAANSAGGSVRLDGGIPTGTGAVGDILLGSIRGNVGIGTTAPTAKLHLPAGKIAAGTSPLKFEPTAATLMTAPENGAMEFDGADYYLTASGTRNKIATSAGGAGSFVAKTGDTMTGALNNNTNSASAAIAVTQSGAGPAATFTGGNVGVGTTAPISLFQVSKTQSGETQISIENRNNVAVSTSTALVFKGYRDVQSDYQLGKIQMQSRVSGGAGELAQDGDMIFYTGGYAGLGNSPRMAILSGGNVGIGTTAPNTTLDINGAESMRGIAAPAVSVAGQGRIYFDSTSNTYKVSQNNGAYSDLATTASVGTSFVAKAGDTMTGPLVNNSNSGAGTAAVAVTQSGTGYSATFMGGNVGVGTTAPTGNFDIKNKSVMNPDVANGPAAIAYKFDTTNDLSTTGAKFFSIANNGNEILTVQKYGGGVGYPLLQTNSYGLKIGAASGSIEINTNIIASTSITPNNGYSGTVHLGIPGSYELSNSWGDTLTRKVRAPTVSIDRNDPAVNLHVSGGNAGTISTGSNQNAGNVLLYGGTPFSAGTIGNVIIAHDGTSAKGNVGIGTTTPNTALDINGAVSMRGIVAPAVSVAAQGRIYFDSTSNTYKVSQNNGAYSDLATTASIGSSFVAKAGDTMTGALNNNTNSASAAIAVTQSGAGPTATFMGGNVGIGTTVPAAKLEVSGTSRISTSGNSFAFSEEAVYTRFFAATAVGSYVEIANYNTPVGQGPYSFEVDIISYNGAGDHSKKFILNGNYDDTNGVGWREVIPINNSGPRGGEYTLDIGGSSVSSGASLTLRLRATSTLSGGEVVTVRLKSTGTTLVGALSGTGSASAPGVYTRHSLLTQTAGNVGIGMAAPNTALDINGAVSMRGIAAPAVSVAAQGRIYFDSTSNTYRVSQNNGAYSDLATTASIGSSFVAKAGDTMTGALVNTTNSASTALAVTQAGAGNAASFVGGNVGIGTTTPSALLHVASGVGESIRLGGGAYTSISTDAWGALTFASANAEGGYTFNSNNQGFKVGTNANAKIRFATSGTDRLTIDGTANGNVGIGTTGPASQLHIAGNATGSGSGEIKIESPGYNNAFIQSFYGKTRITNNGISKNVGGNGMTYEKSAALSFLELDAGNFYFSTAPSGTAGAFASDTKAMTILNGGNVGIGNSSPQTTLDVTGTGRFSGQVSSGSQTITGGTTAIDWNNGNAISTDYNCAAPMTFANLKDGGTYTLIVTDPGTALCSFSTTTTGGGAATVTYRFKPVNAARSASSYTVYTFLRVGTVVLVSWSSGF